MSDTPTDHQRIAPDGMSVANVAAAKPVSPTGAPMLSPKLAPWLAVAVAIAAVVPMVPGLPAVATSIAGVVVALGGALGIMSPGARKP